MAQHNKRWHWLFLALWLTVVQSAAVAHDAEQPLLHEDSHCSLCNFGDQDLSGPFALPQAVSFGTLVTDIFVLTELAPANNTVYSAHARAPPASPFY